MHARSWVTAVALATGVALAVGGSAAADPPAHVPGGPCIEPGQQVSLSSLPSYEQVVRQLRSIEATSTGAVEVASAGLSGEGRQPKLALDLHHFGQASRVQGTNELNTFQIGARSIDPSRMTAEQWLTNRQMALISVDAVSRMGPANVARYPLIDITNAVLSRMLMGGTAPPGSAPSGFTTQGAIFYEVRSVGQKSNGMLEQLFVRPSMAVLNAAADGSLYNHTGTGWDALPFGEGVPCGGGADF
jgi:hypothetical protein